MKKTDKIIEMAKDKTRTKEEELVKIIKKLVSRDEKISVYGLSKISGISKSFIRNNKNIYDLVKSYRTNIPIVNISSEKQIIKFQKTKILQLESELKLLKKANDGERYIKCNDALEKANQEIKSLKQQLEIAYKY